jgi:hypothetical protein
LGAEVEGSATEDAVTCTGAGVPAAGIAFPAFPTLCKASLSTVGSGPGSDSIAGRASTTAVEDDDDGIKASAEHPRRSAMSSSVSSPCFVTVTRAR